MRKSLAAIAAVLIAACGGSSSTGTSGSNATVAITSPQSGASVALGTDAQKSVPVSFTLTNFTLKPAGSCAGAANCGHIHLVIDAATSPCNTSHGATSGDAYNAQITSGTSGNAQFAICGSGAAGTHSITLELADDGHGLLKDAGGNTIQSAVTGIVTH